MASAGFINELSEFMKDGNNLAQLKTMLGLTAEREAKVIAKTIEEKNFRRQEVYAGVVGTWQEWSFNFLTTVEGINGKVGEVLTDIAKKSATSLTTEALLPLVPYDLRVKHGAELFGVLCQLTTGEANAVVRGVTAKIGIG